MPFVGHFRSYKGGHRLNWMALKALLADATAHEILREPVRAEAGVAVATAVMAPSKA